ncbi:hypothetical protein K1T71_009296 [Dendrolimus kikuchii]|uniref:Uncharacterized protein n=1 Tax=Dendrolimus kikuchii TaxID=765133 RepID=A0ACC1CU62_9NEOP|nr:hypothetical protein K1T71_009296 [Dendrolimus kikuchii]
MIDISIIIPVYNGEQWIDECMKSIAAQSALNTEIKFEIVVYNDGSNDDTCNLLVKWAEYFFKHSVNLIITGENYSKGVGAAKNAAVRASSGRYLCFQDVDDVMHPDRLILQWNAAKKKDNVIVGSRIIREPYGSTPRLVKWANNLTANQLKLQIYTSNGPTLLMPTWFCHRSVYNKIGGFVESSPGTPEDLIFFYSHLDLGGDLFRVDEELVIYTYHEGATTFSVTRERIWQIQIKRLEDNVLQHWDDFTVWNAGKQGRKFVRSLIPYNLNKVKSFCDIDRNKIGKIIELYCPMRRSVLKKLKVFHFTEVKPPLVICMKLDLTNGEFEKNLNSLNLIEGIDYVIFN